MLVAPDFKKTYTTLLILLCVVCLFPLQSFAQTTITGVELKRKGRQIGVLVLADSALNYEINANLQARTLVAKFKNTKNGLPRGKTEHLFNDPDIEGLRLIDMGEDLWVQFKIRQNNLIYSIAESKKPEVLEINFRSMIDVTPLPSVYDQAAIQLKKVRFGEHSSKDGPGFSRITFEFSNERPRLVTLDEPKQGIMTFRMPNTNPIKDLIIPSNKKLQDEFPYHDGRIAFKEIRSEPGQSFVSISILPTELKLVKMPLDSPPRWVLDFHGTPLSQTDLEAQSASLDPAEAQKLENERILRDNRNIELRNLYQTADNMFRRGEYSSATEAFRQVYSQAKKNTTEFDDPMNVLGVQSLFRAGDAIYTILDNNNARNFHSAIDAYKLAIRLSNDYDVAKDAVPPAYFRIARSYQRMGFSNETDRVFQTLKDNFPTSPEAVDANFWKAVNQVSRREWQQAIKDFKEYLRASPNPKFLATTQYKLGQTYYKLGQFITAKEAFDAARVLDPEQPKADPTLLFHMGETYYENADYVTAREIFKILLRRYPNADFSKFIALRLGDFLRDEGKEEEAIVVYKNAVNSYSQDIAVLGHMRIANILAKRPYSEDYREAIRTYSSIATLPGNSPQAEEAMLRKGLTLTLFGFYRDAIVALEQFMEKFPQSPYVQRGVVQENIDENLKGLIDQQFRIKDYLKVVGTYNDYQSRYLLDFRFDTTLFQVAIAYRQLGLHNEALDLFKFLGSRSEGAMRELVDLQTAETLASRADFNGARDQLTRFLRQYPDSLYDADARQLLAQIYQREQDLPSAIVVYEQTIEKYDQSRDPLRAEIVPELYHALASLYERLGRYAEAAEAYQKTISRYNHPVVGKSVPDFIVNSHFLAADMLRKINSDPEALANYEEALSLYKGRTDPATKEQLNWARFQTGVLHQKQGRDQQAMSVFKQLIDSPEGAGSLWKDMSIKNYQLLTQQLAYKNYLKQ